MCFWSTFLDFVPKPVGTPKSPAIELMACNLAPPALDACNCTLWLEPGSLVKLSPQHNKALAFRNPHSHALLLASREQLKEHYRCRH